MNQTNTSSDPADFRTLGKPIDAAAGVRVDRYLGDNYPFHSRAQWQKVIKAGDVRINSQLVRRSYQLRAGDQVSYYHPQDHEPEVNTNIHTVWEEQGIKAVYKPGNLPMHEGGKYKHNTFARVLAETYGRSWSAIHRLDRETSGIVLCGNSSEMRAQLTTEMLAHRIRKTYFAIGMGTAPQQEWVVDQPIGEASNTRFRIKQWVEPETGQFAKTEFTCLEQKSQACLMQVSPITGRTHQIRVHAAWCNLPLVGDKKYHPNEQVYLDYLDHGYTASTEDHCWTDRMCLHAGRIRFRHPVLDQEIEVECPIPEDMQTIWDQI